MKSCYAMLAAAAAALLLASSANAVDMHGYFREGIGGSSKGGDQVAFQNNGQEFKLRLANEDNWSEFEFDQPILKDKNGVEWSFSYMLDWSGNGWSNNNALAFDIEQEWVKATFPQLGGATVWAGKRFYHRLANDIIDYFYVNESNNMGVGIEDVNTGFGKFAGAIFKGQSKTAYESEWFADLRLEAIPVNPGGTLDVGVLPKIRTWNKDLAGGKADDVLGYKSSDFSIFAFAKHSQSGILNGGNNFAVTFRNGCWLDLAGQVKASDVTLSDPDTFTTSCSDKQWKLTASEDLLLQPTKQFSVVLSGVYNRYSLDTSDFGGSKTYDANAFFVGGRPYFKVADHFALQGDLGYFYFKWSNKDMQDKANTMVKATFAPTIVPFTDGYAWGVRPEIRFYVTYASWNKEQDAAHPTFVGDESGTTFGSYVEAWF